MRVVCVGGCFQFGFGLVEQRLVFEFNGFFQGVFTRCLDAFCHLFWAGNGCDIVLVLDQQVKYPAISFNGAFFPVTGVAGQFFSPLAKTFANATLVQKLFAKMADRKAVERLLRDTGSNIDAEGITLYQQLFSNEGHIAGTLGMMAAWDLHWVPQDLKNLPVPMTLVFASGDRTIPPARAAEAAKLVPRSSLIEIKGLGHLAHEEDPTGAAAIVADPASFVLR